MHPEQQEGDSRKELLPEGSENRKKTQNIKLALFHAFFSSSMVVSFLKAHVCRCVATSPFLNKEKVTEKKQNKPVYNNKTEVRIQIN